MAGTQALCPACDGLALESEKQNPNRMPDGNDGLQLADQTLKEVIPGRKENGQTLKRPRLKTRKPWVPEAMQAWSPSSSGQAPGLRPSPTLMPCTDQEELTVAVSHGLAACTGASSKRLSKAARPERDDTASSGQGGKQGWVRGGIGEWRGLEGHTRAFCSGVFSLRMDAGCMSTWEESMALLLTTGHTS